MPWSSDSKPNSSVYDVLFNNNDQIVWLGLMPGDVEITPLSGVSEHLTGLFCSVYKGQLTASWLKDLGSKLSGAGGAVQNADLGLAGGGADVLIVQRLENQRDKSKGIHLLPSKLMGALPRNEQRAGLLRPNGLWVN